MAVKVLSVNEYGIFAVIISLTLILLHFHSNLISSPLFNLYYKLNEIKHRDGIIDFFDYLFLAFLIVFLILIFFIVIYLYNFKTFFILIYLSSVLTLEYGYKRSLLIIFKKISKIFLLLNLIIIFCIYKNTFNLNELLLTLSSINFFGFVCLAVQWRRKFKSSLFILNKEINNYKIFIKPQLILLILILLNEQLFFLNAYNYLEIQQASCIRAFLVLTYALNIFSLTFENLVPKIMSNIKSISLKKTLKYFLGYLIIFIIGFIFCDYLSNFIINFFLKKEYVEFSNYLKYFYSYSYFMLGYSFFHTVIRFARHSRKLILIHLVNLIFIYFIGIYLVKINQLSGYILTINIYSLSLLIISFIIFFKLKIRSNY